MIIRKPFAFIVKHYKVIHLLLLIPLLYIAYKTSRIMSFFNSFASHGYRTDLVDVAKTYYNFLITLFPLIIVIFGIIIIVLFSNKKKGFGAYAIITSFYLVYFIASFLFPGILNAFETKDIESAIAIMVSGLSSILFYAQPVMIIIFLLKGFGFDFKNFDFNNISDEISLDEEDSEEIEVNVNLEDYRFKRGIRRYIRELKYYVIENKIFFMTIGGIIALILLFFVGKWIISLNRIVKIDKTFAHSQFSVSFNDSLLSTLDYNGNVIQKDKIYLAVKTTIKNKTNGLRQLDTDAFWLEVDGKNYYPVLDRSGKFLDLAKPYYGDNLGPGKQEEIVLVYELDTAQIHNKYRIRVLDKVTYKENTIIPKYKEITLRPKYSASIKDKGEYNLGDTINLKDTLLLNSEINFTKYQIGKTYQYHYDYCYNEKCTDSINSITAGPNKILLVFDGKMTLDDNSTYAKNKLGSNKMSQDFIKVEYTVNGITHTSDVKDLTPTNSKEEIVAYETDLELRNADSIKLLITVRNLRYKLKVK